MCTKLYKVVKGLSSPPFKNLRPPILRNRTRYLRVRFAASFFAVAPQLVGILALQPHSLLYRAGRVLRLTVLQRQLWQAVQLEPCGLLERTTKVVGMHELRRAVPNAFLPVTVHDRIFDSPQRN